MLLPYIPLIDTLDRVLVSRKPSNAACSKPATLNASMRCEKPESVHRLRVLKTRLQRVQRLAKTLALSK